MAQIEIKKNIKLEDIESYYDTLYGLMNDDLPIDLMLPKELLNYYLGLIPSLYQLTITWVRYQKAGKLLLDFEDPTQIDFDKLYENELLFPLVSLVWNTNEVYNKTGEINLRSYLKKNNKSLFDKMRGVKQTDLFNEYAQVSALKGSKLLLTEFDHLPEEHGILPCFEINGEFVNNESKFYGNLITGVRQVLAYSSDIKDKFSLVSTDLIGMIYELMKNTFEWAKYDENGVPIDPSLRGLLIKFYKKRRNTFLDDFENHKGLNDYFKSDFLKENTQQEIYFLELSVFDSGVGFVDKYKSLNNSKGLSDIDIIRKCLIKHNTSAKGLEKDDKGIGLDRILAILDKKGFLRIKTGNVCIYRNLISNNYKTVNNSNSDEMELFDWSKNSNSEYTSYKRAEGSVVTIIYPLSINATNNE